MDFLGLRIKLISFTLVKESPLHLAGIPLFLIFSPVSGIEAKLKHNTACVSVTQNYREFIKSPITSLPLPGPYLHLVSTWTASPSCLPDKRIF